MKTINNPNPIGKMKTINNPNPIGKMKTINNPNPVASTGRISFKKVISAISLFSLLLFSLLAGANSLQAQERKTGWFVGLSPYAMDLNLEKTTRQTTRQTTTQTTNFSRTGGAIIYDATVPGFYVNAGAQRQFFLFNGQSIADRLEIVAAAIADVIHLCQEGAVPVIPETLSDNPAASADIISILSYAETTDLTDDLISLLTPSSRMYLSNAELQAAATPRCKAFFEADLPTLPMSSTSTADLPLAPVESSKTQSLQGTGIEFGYDFEKYSLSFNQLQWSGGDDKLQAQMLLFRYFLPYALSVGGGFASAKLDTEFGSDSGTAPVFHFGYDYPITKNFQISLSYAWLGVNLAVQDTQSVTTPTTPTTPPPPTIISSSPSTQKRVLIGMQRAGEGIHNDYSAFWGTETIDSIAYDYDTRIVVTATIPFTEVTSRVTETTVQGTSTTIQNTEIKNLSTIKIGFRYSF